MQRKTNPQTAESQESKISIKISFQYFLVLQNQKPSHTHVPYLILPSVKDTNSSLLSNTMGQQTR